MTDANTFKPFDGKPSFRNLKVYLSVMESVDRDNALPSINARLDKYVKRLKTLEFVRKQGYGVWEITDAGRAFLAELKGLQTTTPSRSRCHLRCSSRCSSFDTDKFKKVSKLIPDLDVEFSGRILIPIVKSLEEPFPYDLKKQTGFYQFLRIPEYDIGLTIWKTKADNLVVMVHHKDVEELEDLEIIFRKVITWIKSYYSTRRVFVLDDMHARTVFLKYGIRDPINRKALPKGQSEKVMLGRDAEPVLPKDDLGKAYVSYDNTPDPDTLHSNDGTYVSRWVTMPETLNRLEAQLGGLVQSSLASKNTLLLMAETLKRQTDIQERTFNLIETMDKRILEAVKFRTHRQTIVRRVRGRPIRNRRIREVHKN